MGKSHSDERLTGDEVVLEQLVHPFRRHDEAPLPVLEVLLALVARFACLFDHALDFFRMECVQDLEEEVAFWELVVPVG